MHFDDFSHVVESLAVDRNIRLRDVKVKDLITSQCSHVAWILDGPVKMHERSVSLKAVQGLSEFQAIDEETAILNADDEFVKLLWIELYASDRC